ncbi:hypothetical protein Q2K19_21950 [Micromonospora soli]|uniref:hypothetical protein n=1 Tax=Micromonospora sp. NBRC 110009 TaxID=3061627 RepID=UPI0026738915|nr:hypothetical protein [Micromonospora sp. NBRC 110009]WKT96847.1 hypothetical protein Q2K19_21950 [Micromonospora sp. NBRC 110009]
MTGPAAAPAPRAGRQNAQALQRLYREELPRVRMAALAWRNGLAALLTGLLGFSLVKGRADISGLASTWAVLVGVLLLASLLAGAYAAMRLLRAAHGLPEVVERAVVRSRVAADHDEAIRAQRALRHGIWAFLACAALLIAGVAVTWYGPAKEAQRLRVIATGEVICGTVVGVDSGTLVLKTEYGERAVDLTTVTGISAVDSCPRRE